VKELIEHALAEDVGGGDLTTAAVVPPGARARAHIVQRAPGTIAGLDVAREVFHLLDPALRWHEHVAEGRSRDEQALRQDDLVAEVAGAAAPILAGERTALNLLGRLSGIATLTSKYVAAVDGTGAVILDTRKTTPGLRALEKRAVLAGGGVNHRQGLYDAILIKENHVALAGGIEDAVRRAREAADGASVEVECRDLREVESALEAGAARILLDNMGVAELRKAVALAGGRAELEASGGVTLENVRAVAETGVGFISIGALTHSAPALDLSLLLEPATAA
jgi:nicotinate-nucleotide pyrophosphorylase (carboxylating)